MEPLTATTTRAGDEREAFLDWCRTKNLDGRRAGDYSGYALCDIDPRLEAFQAGWQARAALATAPEQVGESREWIGPYPDAWTALDETRKAVAEVIGTDANTWPTHGNAPLAIASAIALRTATPPASTEAAAGEPIGTLTVRRYRGADSMVNTDFDYYGSLPDGSYRVYTAPPAASGQKLTDAQLDTLRLAIGYIGSSNRADRHEHIARLRAIIAATEGK